MRTTLALFFILVFMLAGGLVHAQHGGTLSLAYRPLQTKGTVGYYLDDIQQRTGVSLSYSSQYVDAARIVKVSDTIASVGALLNSLFRDKDVVFREQGNKILILYEESTEENDPPDVFIHGFVKEAGSKEAIIGAAVYIPGTAMGTITNNYGYYSLQVPAEQCRLVISYLGFIADTFSLRPENDIRHDAFLAAGTDLKEVQVVSAKGQSAGYNHLVHNDIKTRAVLLGENDVIKSVQNLPGVQSGSGAGNLVLVRGGDPGQNLHLLDGVPLYNVDHFYGLSSVYNTDAIRSVDLYKGAFPARFGGRTSSVIDVSTKDGDMQHWGGQMNMGLVKGGLTIEGPLVKDKASIIFSGRRTWIDALWRPFTNDLEFNFYDLNLKANYIVNKNNRLYLSAYNGRDQAGLDMKANAAYTSWGNSTISTRWNSVLSSRLFMNTSVTFSTFNYVLKDKRELIDNGAVTLTDGYKGISAIRDLALRTRFNWTTGTRHNFEFGGQVSHASFNPAEVEFFSKKNNVLGAFPDKVQSNELDFYVEDVVKMGNKVNLIPGIHFANWFSKQFDYSNLQPRFRLEVNLNSRQMLYASYAQMAQFLHLITSNTYGLPTEFWVPSSSRLEPEESAISTIGYRYNADARFYFNVEVYYKDITNATTYDLGKNLFDNYMKWDDKIIQGKGGSYGTEFLLKKKLGAFHVSSAYTLSRSWRRFSQVNDGQPFPYRYDRRHNFKIAVLFQPSRHFDITANWLYMSGEAITIPDQLYPDFDRNLLIGSSATAVSSNNYTYSFAKWNDYRLPPIHRLDVGMNFMKEKKKGRERTWSLGVFNAYAHRNVMFVELSNVSTSGVVGSYKLSGVSVLQFIPYAAYKFTF